MKNKISLLITLTMLGQISVTANATNIDTSEEQESHQNILNQEQTSLR